MNEFGIELNAEDQKMLQVMDEIYYLDWRENDDDEKTAGWRHPGYFLEVGQIYDFSKLVDAGLIEKNSNPDYLAYRITDLGAKTVKKLQSDKEFSHWLSKQHGQPPSPRHG
jgi:hypothetical protein